jgi:membrane protease YdiL (CAAX protease family)
MADPVTSVAAAPQRHHARWLSLLELLAASAVVIGHNVFKVVPNEVPILFIAGWVSLRLRDGGWKAVGLVRPESWKRTAAIALAAAVLLQLLSEYVTVPLITLWTNQPPDLSEFRPLVGNLKLSLIALGLIWTFAAFGEEIVYRGYLLTRAADLGGRTQAAYWIGLVYITVLFGFGHYYQGPAGVVDTAVTSVIFGSAYLLFRRNLWLPILAHGFSNTIALALVFFGVVEV